MNLPKLVVCQSLIRKLSGLLMLFASGGLCAVEKGPNIILMLADDLGWRDLGCYGSELYQTPNIDALAAKGVRFSNAYSASPLCSPTRASILTGQTPGRLRFTTPTGHLPNVVLDPIVPATASPGRPMTNPQTRTRLPLESQTISRQLQYAGYRTSFMGKWHLGFDPYIPENFGFDVVVAGRGFPGPPPPGFFGPWDPAETNMPLVEGRVHADDVLGDEAVRFIRESHNRDQPFFLALWFFDVHAPFVGKEELIKKYRPLAENTVHQKSAIMGAMVETMDDNVGKVMRVIDELGLEGETIIIFTSDNGGNMYDRPEGVNPTSNYPLRAGKGNNHEGGIRVPLIVSWPGKVAENKQSDTVAISYDFFPTLLDVAGVDAPEGGILDGVSLLSSFDGSTNKRPPIYSMFGHTVVATGNIANVWARDGKWKLFKFFNTGPKQVDEYVLYNLEADPGEQVDIAAKHPEVVFRLKDFIGQRLVEEGVLVPGANPKYDADYETLGWRIVDGGLMQGAGKPPSLNVTSPGGIVTMRYYPTVSVKGDAILRVPIMTNCVVSAIAGWGDSPVYGVPAPIVPDLERQVLEMKVPAAGRETGFVTVVFELEQPGRFHLYPTEFLPALD